MSCFRILSLDGGGMNALSTAIVLSYIEKQLKKYSNNQSARICDYFDFFAGTSAGGLLTGVLLMPESPTSKRPMYSADEVVNQFIHLGKDIFKKSVFRNICTLGGITAAKYSSKNLKKSLLKVFGDTKLSECLKPCLFTAYNIGSSRCTYYTRESARAYVERDYYLREILCATSSAPTYFPPAEVTAMSGHKSYMVDGGVFANNPAMCSFTDFDKLGIKHNNIKLLSIGIGSSPNSINCKKSKRWGKVSWAFPILSILFSAASQTTDYQLRTIFRSDFAASTGYLRIDGTNINNMPVLGGMDDASDKNIDKCIEYGSKMIKYYNDKLNSFIFDLLKPDNVKN